MAKQSAPVARGVEIEALQNFASQWAEDKSYLGQLFTPAMVELVVSRINQDISPNLAADLENAQSTVDAHRRTIANLEHNLELSHKETIREQNEHNATRATSAELLSAETGKRIEVENQLTDERQKVADMAGRLEDIARLASSAWLEGRDITPSELRSLIVN